MINILLLSLQLSNLPGEGGGGNSAYENGGDARRLA